MRQSTIGTPWWDRVSASSTEAVAVVCAMVLASGVLVVAVEQQDTPDELDAARGATAGQQVRSEPGSARVGSGEPISPKFAPLPLLATATPVVSAPPVSTPAPARAAVATPDPEASRIVVLAVEAPTRVRVGQTVVFRVSVRASGGTPVLSRAQFGDGTDGGSPARCATPADSSFTGTLEISHTYSAAGRYTPYFVATIPCGPAAGAGTTVTVTDSPAGGPAPSGSPSAAPRPSTSVTPSAGPAPTASPVPSSSLGPSVSPPALSPSASAGPPGSPEPLASDAPG